jgi:hypothetical protein
VILIGAKLKRLIGAKLKRLIGAKLKRLIGAFFFSVTQISLQAQINFKNVEGFGPEQSS